MINNPSKLKQNNLSNQETAVQFYNSSSQQDQQQFLYEIEMQKEYVQRLKIQREKIQTLYSKYDVILSQMKKKDTQIKEKDYTIKTMDMKIKDMELNCQQINLIKQQNREFMNQNLSLKHRIVSLQNQNIEMIQQIKLKQCLVTDQKDELDQINQQLQQKIKVLTSKLLICNEELKNNMEIETKKIENMKTQHYAQVTKLSHEINSLKDEIIKKDQTIHMIRLDSQFLQQKLSDQQENYTIYLKDLEFKIQKNQKQKKLQIKSLKDLLDQKTNQIGSLQLKIKSLNQQLQVREIDFEESKRVQREEKRVFDQDIFQLKTQMTKEKNYFREQFMYCQNHIEKLEKKLTQSLRRQKDLNDKIRKLESNEAAKRNLRQIQRQEMQKINKILSLQ